MLDLFKTTDSQGSNPYTIHVPHTIVIENGLITDWYFPSVKDGSLLKKRRVNLTSQNIIEEFSKHSHPSGVVACFDGTKETKIVGQRELVTMWPLWTNRKEI